MSIMPTFYDVRNKIIGISSCNNMLWPEVEIYAQSPLESFRFIAVQCFPWQWGNKGIERDGNLLEQNEKQQTFRCRLHYVYNRLPNT